MPCPAEPCPGPRAHSTNSSTVMFCEPPRVLRRLRCATAVEPRPELGLVEVRGDRPRMELPRTGANHLRTKRDPGADGLRGQPEPVAPPRDPSTGQLGPPAWSGHAPHRRRQRMARPAASRPMDRDAAPSRGRTQHRDHYPGSPIGIPHRMARRVGTRRPAAPTRASAVDPRTEQRDWSSTTSSYWTEAGTASTRTRTPTPRAACTTRP